MPRLRTLLWIPGTVLILGVIGAQMLPSHFLPCAHPLALIIPPSDQIDRNMAARPYDDLIITRDVPYAAGRRHLLDIYALRANGSAKAAAPRPVVIFIYGGSWASGNKADLAWVGASLARQGYVVIIPDYRIYPEARWPDFLKDNAAAVRWAHDHAASHGGDPRSLVLMGHSAGAFDVASLAVDRRWLAGVGMEPKRDLTAVIGISGP